MHRLDPPRLGCLMLGALAIPATTFAAGPSALIATAHPTLGSWLFVALSSSLPWAEALGARRLLSRRIPICPHCGEDSPRAFPVCRACGRTKAP